MGSSSILFSRFLSLVVSDSNEGNNSLEKIESRKMIQALWLSVLEAQQVLPNAQFIETT